MHLQFAAVCDDAQQRPDGSLDLHGVRFDMSAPGFPASRDRMVFIMVLEWERQDEGRFQFKVDLLDPEGNPSMTVDGHTEVTAVEPHRPPPRTHLIMPLQDVVFPAPGDYRFQIQARGKTFEGPALFLQEVEEGDETGSAHQGVTPRA